MRAPLVVADPTDGSAPLANAEAVRGRLVLLWRGGCSFVDKVRRAQQAGAAAAVVVQADGGKWPFSMSDTTGAGSDLVLPSCMVSPSDGAALKAAIERAAAAREEASAAAVAAGGGGDVASWELWGHARARDHRTSCAVCARPGPPPQKQGVRARLGATMGPRAAGV